MTTSEYDESLQVAEFCLMHRSIMVSCTKPPLNGKNRPNPDIRRNGCLEIAVHKSSPSA